MAIAFVDSAVGGTDPTTTTTITIPAGVATGHILILAATNRDATADPTVTDDDSGGNTWAKVTNQNASGNGAGTVWWKRATSGTASKTVTVDGMTGSMAAGLAVFSGCRSSGNPYAQVSGEANASADETHTNAIGVYPIHPGCFGCIAVFNTGNDNAVGPATLTTADGQTSAFAERFEHLSAGGNDCGVEFATGNLFAATSTRAALISNLVWSQVNGTTASIFFMLLPELSTSDAVYLRSCSGSSASTTTTSTTITIPSDVAADDILIAAFVNRDGTTDPAVVDDDAGGNLWALIAAQAADTNGELTVWWKRATANTASKTITATLFTGSCSGVLSVYVGCETTGNPYENAAGETNASADETHAGITPTKNGSMIYLAVGQTSNDTLNVTTFACTALGNMLAERGRSISTGGTDCAVDWTSEYLLVKGATGDFTWAQTNGTGASIALNLLPETEPTVSSVGVGLTRSILLEPRRLAA